MASDHDSKPEPARGERARSEGPSVCLALQGGGAHGAFTWGVLDALLEDGRLQFEGISGTSAGAMNAVVMAHGLLDGGNGGARRALEAFWTAVAASMPLSATMSADNGNGVALSPTFRSMLRWANYFSPERMNPYDVNPLRDIVAAQIDFDRLRTASPVKLFVAATHANTGQLRLFRTPELSADTLLASACLPTVNRAVEIDGEPYWDGGYSANPAVLPLLQECRAHDMLLVLLSPLRHKGTPGTLEEIRERVLEFAFTTSFLREMRILAQLRDAAAKSWMPPGRFERRVASAHFHLIDAEDVMSDLTAETKLAANMKFFVRLRDLGRARAQAWLHEHFAGVGQRSSVDIGRLFG